ncbi:MAG: hypothetical protein K0R81_121 [Microbacterium sp.]|jgi:hypothetical protein|nr:hypothetical protein [Microbacterium sp.]
MDYERVVGPDGIEIRIPKGVGYRTCAECGGDCVPDPSLTGEGDGVRIAFVCPAHSVQSLVDPFQDLR